MKRYGRRPWPNHTYAPGTFRSMNAKSPRWLPERREWTAWPNSMRLSRERASRISIVDGRRVVAYVLDSRRTSGRLRRAFDELTQRGFDLVLNTGSNVLTVPVILTSDGRTLCALPPWMQVTDNTAAACGSIRRATKYRASDDLRRAQDRVRSQMGLSGMTARATNGMSKRSAAAIIAPGRVATVPIGNDGQLGSA